MAHSANYITERIYRLDRWEADHEQSGVGLPPGSVLVDDGPRIVVRDSRDHGHFHLRTPGGYNPKNRRGTLRYEDRGYLYQPLHPDMTAEDIEGATYAWDDGTYWLFAHCSPGEQLDFAAAVRTFTFNQFQPALVKANTALGRGGVGAANAADKARALTDFAEQAANRAFEIVKFKTLGYYCRDPHRAHNREIAVQAMDQVTAAWAKNTSRLSDRARVQNTVVILREQLTKEHDIDWRHERSRDLAASGRDPIDGHEYCYTLSAAGAPITVEADLPDPGWNFDAFPAQGATMGAATYYDREPTTSESMPFVIRFRRPLPTPEPTPGADIGSVEWVQEKAYRPE